MDNVHFVKCYEDLFRLLETGEMNFWHQRPYEINYKVGDLMEFEEFELGTLGYTGNQLRMKVTHVMSCGEIGVPGSYAILALRGEY